MEVESLRIKVAVEEFLELPIRHVPDRYAHNIRYFGLASRLLLPHCPCLQEIRGG